MVRIAIITIIVVIVLLKKLLMIIYPMKKTKQRKIHARDKPHVYNLIM